MMSRRTERPGLPYRGRKNTGQQAEQLAIDFLLHKGYQIVETNWRHRLGELDIIAQDKGVLVFVEVRAKASAKRPVHVLEAIPRTKQNQVRKLAELYLAAHFERLPPVRIDAILVHHDLVSENPMIIHLENAF